MLFAACSAVFSFLWSCGFFSQSASQFGFRVLVCEEETREEGAFVSRGLVFLAGEAEFGVLGGCALKKVVGMGFGRAERKGFLRFLGVFVWFSRGVRSGEKEEAGRGVALIGGGDTALFSGGPTTS